MLREKDFRARSSTTAAVKMCTTPNNMFFVAEDLGHGNQFPSVLVYFLLTYAQWKRRYYYYYYYYY